MARTKTGHGKNECGKYKCRGGCESKKHKGSRDPQIAQIERDRRTAFLCWFQEQVEENYKATVDNILEDKKLNWDELSEDQKREVFDEAEENIIDETLMYHQDLPSDSIQLIEKYEDYFCPGGLQFQASYFYNAVSTEDFYNDIPLPENPYEEEE